LSDVARQAGVSIATASRVLNDKPAVVPIKEETRQRIQQAASELAYTPNAMARALSSRRTHTLGVVCYDIGDPLVAPFIEAIESVAEEHHYRLMVCSTRRDYALEAGDARAHVRVLCESRVDGIILLSDLVAANGEARELCRAGVPIALVGVDPYGVANVRGEFDYYAGARAVAQHLATLGHRHVAFLGGGARLSHSGTRRLEGLRERLTSHGADLVTVEHEGPPPMMEAGRAMIRQLLAQHPEVTAAVARNDAIALGALRTLHEAGVGVPDTFSLVGYGDVFYAAYLRPALTTVRTPVDEMGRRITAALLAAIGAEQPHPTLVTLEPQLIIRESTAHAPEGER